jgi:hypothetical protein
MTTASMTMMSSDDIKSEFGWKDDMILFLLQNPDSPHARRCKDTGAYTYGLYHRERVLAVTVSTRCRNKLCVRHLRLKSRAEIMASVPRRWASGEDSWLARISSKQVLLIRNLYTKGNVTQSALAERFGMSTSNMKRILARRSWKHI